MKPRLFPGNNTVGIFLCLCLKAWMVICEEGEPTLLHIDILLGSKQQPRLLEL